MGLKEVSENYDKNYAPCYFCDAKEVNTNNALGQEPYFACFSCYEKLAIDAETKPRDWKKLSRGQKKDSKEKLLMSEPKQCLDCKEKLHRTHESPKRWKNRKYCDASCQMSYEYKNGRRDKENTVKEAQEAIRKKAMEQFKKNPSTKDWRGWTKIYIPSGHPELEQEWMTEHRYVWWKNTGEFPPEDKVIHHIDGNKKNNDFDNLELVSREKHAKIHNSKEKVTKPCKMCGEEFSFPPSGKGRRITCSRECQVKWQKEYR